MFLFIFSSLVRLEAVLRFEKIYQKLIKDGNEHLLKNIPECVKVFEKRVLVQYMESRSEKEEAGELLQMEASVSRYETEYQCMQNDTSNGCRPLLFVFPDSAEQRLNIVPGTTHFLKYFEVRPKERPRLLESVAMELCGNLLALHLGVDKDCYCPLRYFGSFYKRTVFAFFAVYDAAHCDLFYFGDHLFQRRMLNSPLVYLVVRKLLEAAAGLQQVGLIHADIKPENVVLACDGKRAGKYKDFQSLVDCRPKRLRVWFVDFECAEASPYAKGVEPCDTKITRAPELFSEWVPTLESDVWSLAASIVLLFVNAEPSNVASKFCEFVLIEELSKESVIEELGETLLTLQEFEAEKTRCAFETSAFLDWENSVGDDFLKDLLKQMLRVNPKKRIKFKDVLEHPFFSRHK